MNDNIKASQNDLKCTRAVFLEQFRLAVQGYLDEAGRESDDFVEGQDVTFHGAVEMFNDILLYVNEGEELRPEQLVKSPTNWTPDDES